MILKIIENGANPYFTLSYQNTNELKELYPKYYSVDFDIWKDDLISTYKILNEALKDVQTARIIDHKFITATRELSDEEQKQYDLAEAEAKIAYQEAYDAAKTKYDNGIAIAKRRAEENGEVFDLEAYVEENGEFEFLEFADYYHPELNTHIDDFSVVYMRFENGVQFVLNYNSFPIKVQLEGMEKPTIIEAMSFSRSPELERGNDQ